MRSAIMACFLLTFLGSATVLAEENPPKPRVFEHEVIVAGGGAPLLPILLDWEKQHTSMFSGFLAGRLRAPDYTSLGLEANAVLPFGIGLNGFIDVTHLKKMRAHFSFGIFMNLVESVSVTQVDRLLDITAGLGVEIQMTKKTRLTVDWRTFLPWPWDTIPRYGDFCRPFYEEAVKGGQLWIGVAQGW